MVRIHIVEYIEYEGFFDIDTDDPVQAREILRQRISRSSSRPIPESLVMNIEGFHFEPAFPLLHDETDNDLPVGEPPATSEIALFRTEQLQPDAKMIISDTPKLLSRAVHF